MYGPTYQDYTVCTGKYLPPFYVCPSWQANEDWVYSISQIIFNTSCVWANSRRK